MTTPSVLKPQAGPSVQEFSIRVPKNTDKKHNVMRFNETLKVEFSEWSQVKMERENNMKEYKGIEEDMPKFGAGSEFGRDAREEARRKKFGITSRKYKPEDQPWILKSGGRTGKKFRGTRDGGVNENASYYVFTHAPDGAIEAFPLHEWYNFRPIQRYKPLSAEEAEQELSRRNHTMNYWSLMCRKRLRIDEDGGDDDSELTEAGRKAGKKPAKKDKELKISEMDEWMESDDDDDDSASDADKEKKKGGSDEEDDAKKNKKANKAVTKKKKKKKNTSDDEAFEDSDDGDEEGRECDYISDSTDAESENEQHSTVKSVAEEDALRKLLASDEDDEDEEQNEKKEGDEDGSSADETKDKEDKEKEKSSKDLDKKKDKKKKKKQSKKKETKKASPTKDSSSDFSSDSASDSDVPTKEKDNRKSNSAHSSRSATPTPAVTSTVANDQHKRKQTSSPDLSQSKKLKLDNFNLVPSTSYIPGSSESGITEDAVRRYLMRKPMTTTELLQKFKSKKTGLTSEQLVNVMTQILKKINPTKQTFKNKMYLSIKAQASI